MKFPKLSDRAQSVVKFEAKLLLGVVVGGMLLAWLVNYFIYRTADSIVIMPRAEFEQAVGLK